MRKKKAFHPTSRTAPEPGQSLNVDLCFVPAEHEGEKKLPAVSGSSGKLVIERTETEAEAKWHPGQVFSHEGLSYEAAMAQFVADSQLDGADVSAACSPEAVGRAEAKAEKAALGQAEEELKVVRRRQRQEGKQEDKAWREGRDAERQAKEKRKKEQAAGQKAAYGSQKALKEAHRQRRQRRRQQLAQRKQQDEQWRQQRQEIRQRRQGPGLSMAWIAILVITDNCTRQCVGLPLFGAGSHVTAEMVVEALRTLLPPALQFLISDRGVHFTAKVFQQLAQQEEFIHVLIARHRPQSNGIAERFVRTLKEWLRDKSWQSPEELEALIKQFRLQYNDRPHQGLSVPGLSPNEYANRLWVT
jgi:transposase InsO family protein